MTAAERAAALADLRDARDYHVRIAGVYATMHGRSAPGTESDPRLHVGVIDHADDVRRHLEAAGEAHMRVEQVCQIGRLAASRERATGPESPETSPRPAGHSGVRA